MRESLRRIILFIVIVTIGSITILFDVPLIVLIPLIIAVGFIITLLTGALTVSEIIAFFKRKKAPTEKKASFFSRIIKRKPVENTAAQPSGKNVPPPVKKEPVKPEGDKVGKVSKVNSFFSSFRSLGTVIKGRRQRKKRVEEIDKQLDRTISQKRPKSAPTGTGTEEKTGTPGKGGGAVSASVDTPKDQDPFLSLSTDEFDTDLLAGLEDQDASSMPPAGSGSAMPDPNAAADQSVSDSPVSPPSTDIDSAAQDILRGNDMGGPDALGGLDKLSETSDSLDMDLGDLDNLNLDDVVLDEETDKTIPETTDSSGIPEKKPKSSESPPESTKVKTDGWISSDAPIDLEKELDQESTQADMIAFAGGTGGDNDLLSSLSTDIKRVKIKKDLSLLRDLKDYRGTATEIESELGEIYGLLKAIKKPEK